MGQALRAYDLTEADRVHAARTLRSAFHGFSHLESGDGHPLPHDPEDTFQHLVELLCAGIGRLSRSSGNSRGLPPSGPARVPAGQRQGRLMVRLGFLLDSDRGV